MCYNFPFPGISELICSPSPTNNTVKSEDEPWAWDAEPGPCGEKKWFCRRHEKIVDIKDKTDESISEYQHDHWGCLFFIVSPQVLGF